MKLFIKILKKIKIRSLVILILLLGFNTYAWFIYATRVASDISVHISSWNVEFSVGENGNVTNLIIDVERIYPGMENEEKVVTVKNTGEIKAELEYQLNSLKVLDDYYKVGENITDEELLNKINKEYPFKINVTKDDNLNKELLEFSNVSIIIDNKTTSQSLGSMLDSLDSVIVVLIVAAALLTFVIMYNLSTINISERKREIATLKVLGFYDREVDSYITRENVILTIIGIVFGLISGVYLSYYLISTCEPQSIMFVKTVELDSYIISALISSIFMIIVNFVTHNSLKHINMVESLKNVE